MKLYFSRSEIYYQESHSVSAVRAAPTMSIPSCSSALRIESSKWLWKQHAQPFEEQAIGLPPKNV